MVTIHASYLDSDEFDAMSVKHFSSIDDGTPSNPSGKFQQALEKLVLHDQTYPGFFDNTLGLREFKALHARRHYLAWPSSSFRCNTILKQSATSSQSSFRYVYRSV